MEQLINFIIRPPRLVATLTTRKKATGEPNVVTEVAKPLFKKPRSRDIYSADGLDCEDAAKLRMPVFGKRNVKKKVDNPGMTIKFTTLQEITSDKGIRQIRGISHI